MRMGNSSLMDCCVPHSKTILNKRVKMGRKVKGGVGNISEICVYLWIFPRVFPATALNLSGRISILAASWPGRCWCPARPPVLPERALSRSLPLSSLPTHSSLNLTLMGYTEVSEASGQTYWWGSKQNPHAFLTISFYFDFFFLFWQKGSF